MKRFDSGSIVVREIPPRYSRLVDVTHSHHSYSVSRGLRACIVRTRFMHVTLGHHDPGKTPAPPLRGFAGRMFPAQRGNRLIKTSNRGNGNHHRYNGGSGDISTIPALSCTIFVLLFILKTIDRRHIGQ